MIRRRDSLIVALVGLSAWLLSAAEPIASGWPDLSGYPWLYRRDEPATLPDEPVVTLLAVGDIFLGRGVANEAAPLGLVAAWLDSADFTLGNLESSLPTDPMPAPDKPAIYQLFSPADSGERLARAGFDLLSLANNHALDGGVTGFQESAENLRRAGLIPLGLGSPPTPVFLTRHGLRLAFLAFNAVTESAPAVTDPRATWDAVTGPAAIADARAQADVLVVSVHWGREFQRQPEAAQRAMAQAMLDAGADVILGQHPHVAQAVVTPSCGRLVAFSLGNFVFDQDSAETGPGVALRLWLDRRGVRAAQALPVAAGRRPRLLPPERAADWAAQRQADTQLSFVCREDGCQATPALSQAAGSGLFWGGAGDLTGDGRPELARRVGDRITIYQAGQPVWQSPPTWRVVDADLGDPNDDGRTELMLALFRADAQGIERSQPYLIGYRGGAYQLLWGGRPVNDPIRELAVGDIDGDQVEELVVIEEHSDGSGQTLAVWQWSGWSFRLAWRSPLGQYHDLNIVSADSGQPALIQAATPAETSAICDP